MTRNREVKLSPITVMTVIGTRPEAIKLAPVILQLQKVAELEPGRLRSVVALTGQHRELVDRMLEVFGIEARYNLNLMQPGQTLEDVTSRVVQGMSSLLKAVQPDLVLVQGDTTTVFGTSLAAFYQRIPVGHVEAGLRSGDRYNPFPEELNRVLTSRLATLHFAPTERAKRNLLAEGIVPGSIQVTGNTVIDALYHVLRNGRAPEPELTSEVLRHYRPGRKGDRLVLVTLHRRESWGLPMVDVCRALRRLVDTVEDVSMVLPVHPNPTVAATVHDVLSDHPRIHLVEPLDYVSFVTLLNLSTLVVTDSGGIQEEAPALGKPVLVVRDTTERPEAIEAGVARLVGTAGDVLYDVALELLTDQVAYKAMAVGVSPFGDGHAAERIVSHILAWSGRDGTSEAGKGSAKRRGVDRHLRTWPETSSIMVEERQRLVRRDEESA